MTIGEGGEGKAQAIEEENRGLRRRLEGLERQHQATEERLRSAHRQLEALWNVTSLADADFKTLCDHVLETIVRMTGSAVGFYGFIDEDEAVMTIHTWSGEAMKGCHLVDKPSRFPICDSGVWAEAVRQRKPFLLNDFSAAHPAKKGLPAGHLPLSNLLVVPFFNRSRIVTVAAVANREAGYVQEDVNQINSFLSGIQSLTERMRTELALRESESRYRSLVESSSDVIVSFDRQGRHLFVSPAIEGLTGLDPAHYLGKTHAELGFPAAQVRFWEETIQAVFGTGQPVQTEVEYARDGRHVLLDLRLFPVRTDHQVVSVLSIARDITERRWAEEQRLELERRMLHAQRLESLGVLAGGLAHDFNNLLAIVTGNVAFARDETGSLSPARGYLDNVDRAVKRAAELTRQMLAYAGKGRFFVELVNLSRMAAEMGELVRTSVSKKANLRFELMPDLPEVKADASQLNQVIMNLVINASEALGDSPGEIRVRTATAQLDPASAAGLFPGAAPEAGAYVVLEVRDTGCGMDEETQGKIFDPFFTTKFTGRGLGLAAVQGIVRAHRGAIHVTSQPGWGSAFTIYLPIHEPPPETRTEAQRPVPERDLRGTILVADDEELLRAVLRRQLEALGFRVLEAADGLAALELFRTHREEISLVLLDFKMPKLDGTETLQALRQMAPEVRAILSSGYTAEEAAEAHGAIGWSGFLQKPYSAEDLERLIVALLPH